MDNQISLLWNNFLRCGTTDVEENITLTWLELFIFEYYRNIHKAESNEIKKFKAAPSHVSYHLLSLIYSICVSMTNEPERTGNLTENDNNNDDVVTLRNFLVEGIGSRLIRLLSDLDVTNISNERELSHMLTNIFPTGKWEVNPMGTLQLITRKEVLKIYKSLWLLHPKKKPHSIKRVIKKTNQIEEASSEIEDNSSFIAESYEEFITEEFNNRSQTMRLTSADMSLRILKILYDLLQNENVGALSNTDQASVTAHTLEFCLETLERLNTETIFNDDDQNVLKIKVIEVMFMCLNNLVDLDGKEMLPVFKKLFSIFETGNAEVSCAMVLAILTILSNLCVKNSKQKAEILKTFELCSHSVLKVMTMIVSSDPDLFFKIQKLLMNAIDNIKMANEKKNVKKNKQVVNSLRNHHNSVKEICIFERMLLDSLPIGNGCLVNISVIEYFRKNGICCCNSTIETIGIFLSSREKKSRCMSFIRNKIFQTMFGNTICLICEEKQQSLIFEERYIQLIVDEVRKSKSSQLNSLLYHLCRLCEIFPYQYLIRVQNDVILPIFKHAKRKLLENPENPTENYDAKTVLTYCLNIFATSMRDTKMVTSFFTVENILHLKDCSMIPVVCRTVCQLIKIAIENEKLLNEELSQMIKQILFSNISYLIDELRCLYGQIHLTKNISAITEFNQDDTENEFEILDEATVTVKENLTNNNILLLNSLYWNMISDLIAEYKPFQEDFVANIYNNFNDNVLFTIVYNCLNSILLTNEISSYSDTPRNSKSPEPTLNYEEVTLVNSFSDNKYHLSVLIDSYDLNYDNVLELIYKFHEKNSSFVKILQSEDETTRCLVFRVNRGKYSNFLNLVHRDNFQSDLQIDLSDIALDPIENLYRKIVNNFNIDRKFIGEKFTDLFNKFVTQREDYDNSLNRQLTIQEITNPVCIEYLSIIARNCFDVLWKISDNINFTTNMSAALQELKMLLLQDCWNTEECGQTILDTLQLLLRVAEVKSVNILALNRILVMSQATNDKNLLTKHDMVDAVDNYDSDLDSLDDDVSDPVAPFNDSDEEEKSTEEHYLTAEENYDADEEKFSSCQEQSDCCYNNPRHHRFTSMPLNLGFRSTNQHICKLVVEILIELSQRCVKKKVFWPSILTSLASKLAVMKTYLGGSEFLLKGFTPVLTANDPILSELQKTILELVDDLDCPESLKAYLAILSAEYQPIDQMITRFVTLCNKSATIKPFVEIDYPTFNADTTLTSSCDSHLLRLVQNVREVHLENNQSSPFTESSQLVPLNYVDFQPWNQRGFTLSTWIQLKVTQKDKTKVKTTEDDDEEEDLTSKRCVHVLSAGSEKLMVSIYINQDKTFSVKVHKPNQNLGESKLKKKPKVGSVPSDTKVKDIKEEKNKENVDKSNIFGIGLATLNDTDAPNIHTRGFIRNGINRIMSSATPSTSRKMKTTKITVKSKKSKLRMNRWTHVCFSIRNTDTEILILITADGMEQELIEIPMDSITDIEKSEKLQLLCIGSQQPMTSDGGVIKYSISNVMLFKMAFDSPNLIAHLFALGPDCDSFISCETSQIVTLLSSLDLSKTPVNKSFAKIGSDEYLMKLKSSVLVVYSANCTNTAIGFKKSDKEYGKPMGIIVLGKIPKSVTVASIYRSIVLSGGLSTLIFLFARTVELTNVPETQAKALYILLKMAYSNNHLFAEFEQKKFFNLIAHVFKNSDCYRGAEMLKSILDVIYGNTLINRKSINHDYQINEHSNLNIQSPGLLLMLLENFSIFVPENRKEIPTLDLLFKSLLVVVRDKHPYRDLNRQCLVDHNFLEKLLNFCKIYLSNSSNAIQITKVTAQAITELIKMLIKDSPNLWTLSEMIKLLLLMHHPSESFVTHDRSKFYFILSGIKPTKQNKLNLSINPINQIFSTKIRGKNSVVTPTSPSAPKSPRSPKITDEVKLRHTTESLISQMKNIKVKQIDELTEAESSMIEKALKSPVIKQIMKKKAATPTKTNVRRLNFHRKSVFVRSSTPTKKKVLNDSEEVDPELSILFENLLLANDAGARLNNLSVTSIILPGVENSNNGNIYLQENLFAIMSENILTMDDLNASRMLLLEEEYMKIEMLIMFANHHDPNVRASIIKLIRMIASRQQPEIIALYYKNNYWMHLANQLSANPINMNMAQACADWIGNGNDILNGSTGDMKIVIPEKAALGLMVAMLPMAYDPAIITYITKFLKIIVSYNNEYFQYMVEHGLSVAIVKSLMKLSSQLDKSRDCIYNLMEAVAFKSLSTTGSIQVLWDLLYGLNFAERTKLEVTRECHINLLTFLLKSCLVPQPRKPSTTRKILTINGAMCSLPVSEIKTRFNLIYDRAVQYVTSWESVDDLLTNEMQFVEYLISLTFSGFTQGSPLFLWGLNPPTPVALKLYIIGELSLQDGNLPTGCDPKMIKGLAVSLLQSGIELDSQNKKMVESLCRGPMDSNNWNITQALQKLEHMKFNSQKEQNSHVDKSIYKHESFVQNCIDGAMKLTRDVIDIQNKERRSLMNYMKKTQEMDYYREWYELIKRMTHEEAPWYNSKLTSSSWELDETEGPGRSRIRLKRCTLEIEKRFFGDQFQQKAEYQHQKPLLSYLLCSKETEKYSIRDQIIYTFNAKHLTLEEGINGEVIITDWQLIFLANEDTYNNSIICNIKDIHEIWERSYQHKEIGLEFFLSSQKTFFLILDTNYDRDVIKKFFSDKIDDKNDAQKFELLTQRWTEGFLTNYEYLIELNKLSGRTYNDLMQYPVFPWILADYENLTLDLEKQETFRKFNKTISIQHPEMEEHFTTNYHYLEQSMMENPSAIMKPYHYSSHYSNSGTVLHFLVRVPPFTSQFLIYQDHNFDIPDRTFHSLATTWRLASKDSATDVKELIPEFFFLQEFLENNEGFNFGKRQSGHDVHDVALPTWSEQSARLFVLIHRQALEADLVRKNLNLWINLIFGYQQKGPAAVAAINVFHPATYPEFQIQTTTDVVERSAYETMVRTYGQMPKQLFTTPHPKSNFSLFSASFGEARSVLKNVNGLRWGIYTGSPQLSKPRKIDTLQQNVGKVSSLVSIQQNNFFYGLPAKCNMMKGSKKEGLDLVLWGEPDNIVRVKSLSGNSEKAKRLFHISADPITTCGSHVKHSALWFGHKSGNISVYLRTESSTSLRKPERNTRSFNSALEAIIGIKDVVTNSNVDEEPLIKTSWNYPIVLVKHVGEVVDIKVSVEYSIVVSIGSDLRTVIWDAIKFEYIRTIEPPCNTLDSRLSHVNISSTMGDIITIFTPKKATLSGQTSDSEDESFEVTENNADDFISVSMGMNGKSQLRLHTINAKYVNHKFTDEMITSVAYSFIKEGTGVNVIAVGFDCGFVRLYSSWNLEFIREIAIGMSSPISELIFTTNQHLVMLTQEIQVWESDGMPGLAPKFNNIVFVS